jgi:hypothetical protein
MQPGMQYINDHSLPEFVRVCPSLSMLSANGNPVNKITVSIRKGSMVASGRGTRVHAAAAETPMFRFGVISDIQYGKCAVQ